MSGRLAGKAALVTGGARGQGAAHGRRLAQDGAAVLLADILDGLSEAHARDLRTADHDVHYLHLDVTDSQRWSAAVKAAEERFGRLDVLVNNAGVVRVAPIVDESNDGLEGDDGRQRDRRLLRDARRHPRASAQRRRLDHQHRLHRRPVGFPVTSLTPPARAP